MRILLSLCLVVMACGAATNLAPCEIPEVPPDCAPELECATTCGTWSAEMATQVFSAKGEYRSPNYVSDVPAGGALLAQNLVVARPDIYETHRGEERLSGEFPNGADVKALTEFRGVLIGYGAGQLARYTAGDWVAYDGTYLPPDGPLTDDVGEVIPGKIIFHQTGDSLYFTTSEGVYRLESPTSQPELSGVVQAFTGDTTLSSGVGTALPPGASFAYRYVWGKRTDGGRLILGAPSGRMAVYNTSTTDTKDVNHSVLVPAEVRAVPGYFFQVYRSVNFPVNTVPDDNMALVFEKAVQDMPTSGPYTFTDIDPEPRGAAAYFAPDLGDGLAASKYRPPLATDVVTFNGTTVYLNAQGPQAIDLTLLGVGAPNGLQNGMGIIITFADGTVETHTGGAADVPPSIFRIYTGSASPSINIADTANSLIRSINSHPLQRLRADYLSDDNSTPGQIRITARSLSEGQFIVRHFGRGTAWAPALQGRIVGTGISRTAGVVTVTTSEPHGLLVGQTADLATVDPLPADPNFPLGPKVVTGTPTDTTFTYAEAGASVVGTKDVYIFETTAADVESESDKFSVAWSPLQEPDAVPVLQNAQAGNTDLPVLRALLLDGSLYLLKRDGLFRLQGSTPNTLQVDAIDTTVSFIAPWASWTLGGRAYALTTEGLKVWSESAKPQPASIPIEQDLLNAISQYRQAVDVLSFVVNYESERRLYLWMPSDDSDIAAQYAHVYSYLTDTWTRYTRPANTAIISPELNRMMIAPVESPQLLRERKTRTNADFQGPDGEPIQVDLQYAAQLGGNAVDSKHWGRLFLHFEAATPSLVTASFTTEITTTPQVIPIPGSSTTTAGVLETLVPPETARSRYLYPRIQHAVAQEPFRLLGYTVRHRNYRAQ